MKMGERIAIPMSGFVLVEKLIHKDKDSGLVLPETAQEKAGIMELRVVAIAPDEEEMRIGDITKYMSLTKMGIFKYEGEEYYMVSRKEIGCIIREDTDG